MTDANEFARDREVIAALRRAERDYTDPIDPERKAIRQMYRSEFMQAARTRWLIALDAADARDKRIAELEKIIIKSYAAADEEGHWCAYCGYGPCMNKLFIHHKPDCIVLTIKPKQENGE